VWLLLQGFPVEDAHHGTTLEEPSLQCVRPIAQMDTSRTCADCRERERESQTVETRRGKAVGANWGRNSNFSFDVPEIDLVLRYITSPLFFLYRLPNTRSSSLLMRLQRVEGHQVCSVPLFSVFLALLLSLSSFS
jgi:hypothetical protein